MGVRNKTNIQLIKKTTATSVPVASVPNAGKAKQKNYFVLGNNQSPIPTPGPIEFFGLNVNMTDFIDYVHYMVHRVHPDLEFVVHDYNQDKPFDSKLWGNLQWQEGTKHTPITYPLIVDGIEDYHDFEWVNDILKALQIPLECFEIGFVPQEYRYDRKDGFSGMVGVIDKDITTALANPKVQKLMKEFEEYQEY